MAVRITVATSSAEMEQLAPLWRELYSADPNATTFQSYEWNLLATKIFSARERPVVIAAENGSGAAIIPACITPHGLKFLGDELFDYPGILCVGETAVAARAFEELAQLAPPGSTFSCHG